jgi:hypothetical protein
LGGVVAGGERGDEGGVAGIGAERERADGGEGGGVGGEPVVVGGKGGVGAVKEGEHRVGEGARDAEGGERRADGPHDDLFVRAGADDEAGGEDIGAGAGGRAGGDVGESGVLARVQVERRAAAWRGRRTRGGDGEGEGVFIRREEGWAGRNLRRGEWLWAKTERGKKSNQMAKKYRVTRTGELRWRTGSSKICGSGKNVGPDGRESAQIPSEFGGANVKIVASAVRQGRSSGRNDRNRKFKVLKHHSLVTCEGASQGGRMRSDCNPRG